MTEVLNDLKYAKTHEWVRIDETGLAIIGITDHAQGLLGDLVFVDLPDEGQTVEVGDECVVVESVKAASDVFSPLTGEIVEVNDELTDAPELINKSPYDEGWLFKLRPEDLDGELSQLLTADEYLESLNEEDEEE